MKKIILCLLFFGFILSTPLYTQVQQTPVSLAEAIDESVQELTARIRSGSMIVVFGMQAPTTELSVYITDRILDHLVSKDEMKIVDRQNPDLIAKENEIQISGIVDDNYLQGIGHQFGGEIIITGSMTIEGETYQLRLQALNVRTAQVLGRTSRNVFMDNTLASLLRINWHNPNAWKHKRWYFGVRGGGDFNVLYSLGKDTDGFFDTIDVPFGFHGAVEAGIQITDFFAVQVELMYMRDVVKMKSDGDIYYSWMQNENELKDIHDFFSSIPGFSNHYFTAPSLTLTTDYLLIPVLAKLTARPAIFELSGLVGVYFTVPLGDIKFDFSGGHIRWESGSTYFSHYGVETIDTEFAWDFPPIGLMAGANFGIKLGPGVLFTDIRFAMDFMPVKNKEKSVNSAWIVKSKELFERKKILFDLGYRIGIGNR